MGSNDEPGTHLTGEQWERHVVHRATCSDPLCGNFAHRYVRDLAAGRVYVDGEQIRPDKPGSPERAGWL
jgi:hypothetical protein